MKIDVTGVSKGRRGEALPATTLHFESGRATLATAETAQRPAVLGLIATGRMRPDTGVVTIDGAADSAAIRSQVALVDAPDVNDPAPNVTVYGVVAEELMFAGRPTTPSGIRRALADLGLAQWRSWSISTVPPAVRIRLLAELAVMRQDVEGIVITAPDRHGGDPAEWWAIAQDLAGRGYAVLVVAGAASATALAAGSLVDRLNSESA
ncbi:hypothetical protein OSC27_11725 [Microbacterium sp. STN6]|uniref:hypothetical protein n=1 Tax=Microbacterium sp. STN6 TaxID=2995588 RepID=UPI002260CD97|nr:hypothetical protein [Microbacterium sp. STN6]MCX7522943.1 hypothetical protein [Microbacterium sp. STN6]